MDRALSARLPESRVSPTRLHEAMRYSVLGGLPSPVPAMLFATAHALEVPEEEVEAAACAIELIHAYALVHDDLAGADGKISRHGRAACHEAYDQATAVLVGDALPPLAFQLLAQDPMLPAAAAVRLRLIGLLAAAGGTFGVARAKVYARNSGALLRASILMATECAPSIEPHLRAALARFADAVEGACRIRDGFDATPATPDVSECVQSDRLHALRLESVEALAPFGERARLLRLVAGGLLQA